MSDPPFVVIKFLTQSAHDEELYEVALSSWLSDVDENMKSSVYWPPDHVDASSLIRKQRVKDDSWDLHPVLVKRYYDDYMTARRNVKGIIDNNESNYETDVDLGRGRRSKKKSRFPLDYTDSESEEPPKKCGPAAPKIKVPSFVVKGPSTSSNKPCGVVEIKSSKPKKPEKINQILEKAHGSKTQKELLVERVLESRKKAAQKAERQRDAILNLTEERKAHFKKRTERPDSSSSKRPSSTKPSECGTSFQKQTATTSKNTAPKENQETKESAVVPQTVRVNEGSKFIVTPQKVPPESKKVTPQGSNSRLKSPLILSPGNNPNKPDVRSPVILGGESTPDKLFCPDMNDDPALRDTDPVQPSPIRRTPSAASNLHRASPIPYVKGSHSRALFTSPIQPISFNEGSQLLLKRVEKRLEELNVKMDTVIINQAKLNRQLLPAEHKFQKPHKMPSLPLYSQEELDSFETWLSEDVNLDALADYLAAFALPKDEGAAAVKMMARLMANCLAKHYNFDGNGLKNGLKHLQLWRAIEGALAIKFTNSDLSAALYSIREWLRNAPGRKQEDSLEVTKTSRSSKASTSKMKRHMRSGDKSGDERGSNEYLSG